MFVDGNISVPFPAAGCSGESYLLSLYFLLLFYSFYYVTQSLEGPLKLTMPMTKL